MKLYFKSTGKYKSGSKTIEVTDTNIPHEINPVNAEVYVEKGYAVVFSSSPPEVHNVESEVHCLENNVINLESENLGLKRQIEEYILENKKLVEKLAEKENLLQNQNCDVKKMSREELLEYCKKYNLKADRRMNTDNIIAAVQGHKRKVDCC